MLVNRCLGIQTLLALVVLNSALRTTRNKTTTAYPVRVRLQGSNSTHAFPPFQHGVTVSALLAHIIGILGTLLASGNSAVRAHPILPHSHLLGTLAFTFYEIGLRVGTSTAFVFTATLWAAGLSADKTMSILVRLMIGKMANMLFFNQTRFIIVFFAYPIPIFYTSSHFFNTSSSNLNFIQPTPTYTLTFHKPLPTNLTTSRIPSHTTKTILYIATLTNPLFIHGLLRRTFTVSIYQYG